MIRTFISIDIPREIQKEIKKIQGKLPEFRGKKTEPENLHLTLKFLGEIDEEKFEQIKEKLREIKFEKFETEIKHSGFFDNRKYGIVWLHLSDCENLQKEIDEKLSSLFRKEKRFMSHLTIARIKSVDDKKKFLEELKKIEIPVIKFVVDNFRLKKSVLTFKAPVYETIEEYNPI